MFILQKAREFKINMIKGADNACIESYKTTVIRQNLMVLVLTDKPIAAVAEYLQVERVYTHVISICRNSHFEVSWVYQQAASSMFIYPSIRLVNT